MKSSLLLSFYSAALVAAVAHPNNAQAVLQDTQQPVADPELYLIELSPGTTQWVTEDEKWALRRVSPF